MDVVVKVDSVVVAVVAVVVSGVVVVVVSTVVVVVVVGVVVRGRMVTSTESLAVFLPISVTTNVTL